MTHGNSRTGNLRRDVESTLVPVNEREQLHVRHFAGGRRNCAVVLLHGLNEDGSLFYRELDSLAPELVRAGFDVFVPDLRARGRSWPHLSPEVAAGMDYGFHAAVVEDLATVFGHVREVADDKPLLLLGHGTGGLLWLSFFARWPLAREFVRGLVLAGCATAADTTRFRARLEWRWRAGWYAAFRARRDGLVPGTATRLGGAAEPLRFYREMHELLGGAWIDPVDGFDHAAQLREVPWWPATMLLAADGDQPWSSAEAARRMQSMLPPHDGRLHVFPSEAGIRLTGSRSAFHGGDGCRAVSTLVIDWLALRDSAPHR